LCFDRDVLYLRNAQTTNLVAARDLHRAKRLALDDVIVMNISITNPYLTTSMADIKYAINSCPNLEDLFLV